MVLLLVLLQQPKVPTVFTTAFFFSLTAWAPEEGPGEVSWRRSNNIWRFSEVRTCLLFPREVVGLVGRYLVV